MLRAELQGVDTDASESDLAEALEAYRARLAAMVRRRLDPSLAARIGAEDVLQEAYLRARRKWATQRPATAELYGWLYGIVRDRLVELIRSHRGVVRRVDRDLRWPDGSSAQLALHLVYSGTGPGTAAVRRERRDLVRHALERLDSLDREIVTMRFYDELPFKDIGALLGLSENAANQRCVRALLKIRELLPGLQLH